MYYYSSSEASLIGLAKDVTLSRSASFTMVLYHYRCIKPTRTKMTRLSPKHIACCTGPQAWPMDGPAGVFLTRMRIPNLRVQSVRRCEVWGPA
jgi:hypothetical protein